MAFNVLIVEDSLTMRTVIKKTLEISGFDLGEVFEAGDGKEALAVLEKEWPHLILSDIRMPGMDGFSFLRTLNMRGITSAMPVIMVTTEGREERIEELKGLGAKACIRKPFSPEEIKKTLIDVLGPGKQAMPQKDAVYGRDF